MPKHKTRNLLDNLRSKHSLLMKFVQFKSITKEKKYQIFLQNLRPEN